MIDNIGPVDSVSATGTVPGATVYRRDQVPAAQSGRIGVVAAKTELLATIGGELTAGVFLNAATESYPAVILGATAAQRTRSMCPGRPMRWPRSRQPTPP